MIRMPGTAAPQRRETRMTSLIDVTPTALEIQAQKRKLIWEFPVGGHWFFDLERNPHEI